MRLSYKKLMENEPTIYTTMVNSLGQKIDLVEHPFKGDESVVIAVCHELQIASYTDFYDLEDMLAEHREYEPLFINGTFQHGLE